MVGDGETGGLSRLGHRVHHVQHGPRETGKRLTYPRTEQCRDGAGEEAARAKYYDIRRLYRGNHPPGASVPAGSTATSEMSLSTSYTTDWPRVTVPSA